jgi:sugar/nucleoside kinase (ribokinase family)
MKKKVVGLGEVLWDHLPGRTCLAGAPANFACITTLMGDQGIVASRVGEDSVGLEALRRMENRGSTSITSRPTACASRGLGFHGVNRGLAASGRKGACCTFWIAGTAVRGKPLDHPPFSSSPVSPHRENLRR